MAFGLAYDASSCTLCGLCESECDTFAINVFKDRLEIIEAQCTMCMTCVELCPTGAVRDA